jgi:hypothetical protein
LPIIDFTEGKKQKIMFWDAEKGKEITKEYIETRIGIF